MNTTSWSSTFPNLAGNIQLLIGLSMTVCVSKPIFGDLLTSNLIPFRLELPESMVSMSTSRSRNRPSTQEAVEMTPSMVDCDEVTSQPVMGLWHSGMSIQPHIMTITPVLLPILRAVHILPAVVRNISQLFPIS